MAMRKLFTAPMLIVSMGVTGAVCAQDYVAGHVAYIAKDYATALREWRLQAEQGHPLAQINIGIMYEFGQGVIKDYVYAHMWWNIAASNGASYAKKSRDEIETKMTTVDISKAQELARECVKKLYKGC
jgi:TPR repeat protein